VVESFLLTPSEEGTVLRWQGELGADLWALGRWWGHRVALAWEHAVDASFANIANGDRYFSAIADGAKR